MTEKTLTRRSRIWTRAATRTHLFVYLITVAALVGIDVLTAPDRWWAHWAALSWGVVLLVHALFVYGSQES